MDARVGAGNMSSLSSATTVKAVQVACTTAWVVLADTFLFAACVYCMVGKLFLKQQAISKAGIKLVTKDGFLSVVRKEQLEIGLHSGTF